MQISSGTCSVTNGSATVVASPSTDWSDVLVALQYGTPVLFMLQGITEIPRAVVAAESPNTSTSGNWELTLVSPWSGDDNLAATYLIHKDFTVNLGLPLPTAGEQGWAQLLSKAFEILDANFGAGGIPLTSPDTPLTIAIPTGKTLYMSGLCDIPEGVTIDIQEGGTLEVG